MILNYNGKTIFQNNLKKIWRFDTNVLMFVRTYVNTMTRITEKRKLKGYKIRESIYKKAMRRANKEKTSLAPKIEKWVSAYASGEQVVVLAETVDSITVINK
jgi:hypothetical protein